MENVIEAIRAAIAPDATAEAKNAGVAACRAIITALDANPGEPLAAPVVPSSPVVAMVAALRGVPVDQLLDLAIARLRSALPAGAEAPRYRNQARRKACAGGPRPSARSVRRVRDQAPWSSHRADQQGDGNCDEGARASGAQADCGWHHQDQGQEAVDDVLHQVTALAPTVPRPDDVTQALRRFSSCWRAVAACLVLA